MSEYYILMENNNILCVFFSLMDILSWIPPRILLDALVINRVKEEGGKFSVQKIQISSEIYNSRFVIK